jgi:hypothetical protein
MGDVQTATVSISGANDATPHSPTTSIFVEGAGFPPGIEVAIKVLAPQLFGTAPVGADGGFGWEKTVPRLGAGAGLGVTVSYPSDPADPDSPRVEVEGSGEVFAGGGPAT